MVDLAEKVIQANEADSSRPDGYDELGIKIYDNAEYYVARALRLNNLSRIGDDAPLLHTRNNRTELWLGHHQLDYSPQVIYTLVAPKGKIPEWRRIEIWNTLFKYAPALDETKIIINNHTYWDIEKGELCETDEYLEAID